MNKGFKTVSQSPFANEVKSWPSNGVGSGKQPP